MSPAVRIFSGAFREGGANTGPEHWNFNDRARFGEQASNEWSFSYTATGAKYALA
jgi:hypothetical protein